MNLMLAWFTALGYQTWHSVHDQHQMPLPSQYVATSLYFGVLTFVGAQGPNAEKIAGLLGWGVVLAVYLAAHDNSNVPLGAAMFPTQVAAKGTSTIAQGALNVGQQVGRKGPRPKGGK